MTTKRVLRDAPPVPVQRMAGLPRELRQIQDRSERATRKSRSDNHARGRRVRVTAAASGTQRIAHKLGRKPTAFDMVQLKGAASYTIGTVNSREFTIALSGPGTLDFWVW